jgi:hypothetical protein
MVQTFASIAGNRATARTRETFFEQLARLAEPAAGPDWRYLDAWNNAFEVLGSLGPEGAPAPRLRWLLETYAKLLDARLATLSAGGFQGGPGA